MTVSGSDETAVDVEVGRARDPALREPRVSVLIIDDEPDILETMEMVLSGEGFEVTRALSGEAAVRAARARRFDVAITDLTMPGMSGADTITALREVDPALRIVISTGYASDEQRADCERRGASGYIHKPFDIDELIATVLGTGSG